MLTTKVCLSKYRGMKRDTMNPSKQVDLHGISSAMTVQFCNNKVTKERVCHGTWVYHICQDLLLFALHGSPTFGHPQLPNENFHRKHFIDRIFYWLNIPENKGFQIAIFVNNYISHQSVKCLNLQGLFNFTKKTLIIFIDSPSLHCCVTNMTFSHALISILCYPERINNSFFFKCSHQMKLTPSHT